MPCARLDVSSGSWRDPPGQLGLASCQVVMGGRVRRGLRCLLEMESVSSRIGTVLCGDKSSRG